MQCILFLPSCQVPMYIYISHKWTGFCFCCFFVSFLWWSQTVDVIFGCFPCENSKCLDILQGILSTYEIHGKSNHDSWYTILDLLVWSMSLLVGKFLGRAQLSWWTENVFGQGKIFLTVFHWRSVNTTFDVSWQYARADLGITFRASAALPRCA